VIEVCIIVPVLARPQRVAPLLDSIERTAPEAHVIFITDPADEPEADAIVAARESHPGVTVSMLEHAGGYASKINLGCAVSDERLVFLGADDLEFQEGWLEAAATEIDAGWGVVGVNDMLHRSRARHATHFLISREYALRDSIDGSEGPLFTGYDHSFVDDELIATARARDTYIYCDQARVKHLHPMNGLAEDDETYRKGRARFRRDRRLFERRTALWT
jgi:glycosyltransferase involved in cell wall biosynthesis